MAPNSTGMLPVRSLFLVPAVIEYVTVSSFTSKADTVPTASPTGARALISNEYESALNLGGRGLHAAVVAVSVGDHRPALAL